VTLVLSDSPFGKAIRIKRGNGIHGGWTLFYIGPAIKYYAGHRYNIDFCFRFISKDPYPLNIGWYFGKYKNIGTMYLEPVEIPIGEGWKKASCSITFDSTFINLPCFLGPLENNSELEISQPKLTDLDANESSPGLAALEFLPNKNIGHQVDEKDSYTTRAKLKSYSSRTARWQYGIETFKKKPWLEKIFGSGFTYLEEFGSKFENNNYDYPHNPFISVLLYSGILGLLLYIWLLLKLLWNYYYNFNLLRYFALCSIVVFFFSFLSANTHFSIPVLLFLTIVPFNTELLNDESSNGKYSG
jgi:hypothetical protein